jgi:hypothetical protein
VVAPPEPHEPAWPVSELARRRDLEGGLGIDLYDYE